MLRWFVRTLSSSLGKKFVVALSGLLLVGFLLLHLLGNLLIYAGKSGESFDVYEKTLASNPLLVVAEVGLLTLFVVHVALALRVNMENRDARREGYRVRATLGQRTLASSSMVFTGILVLGFLVVHIADFRISKLFREAAGYSLAAMVSERLRTPLGAGIYLAGVLALAVHLSHAFRSAFQTLGVSHPRLGTLLTRIGWAVAIGLGLGFASFPLFFLAGRGP